MIPVDHKDSIIQNGINFMRSITEAYGSDTGMQLWDTIANTLDPDIKGQIFIALLCGEFDGKLTISGHHSWANKVEMIKALRTVDKRGLGLKEAKDLCDNLQYNHTPIHVEYDRTKRDVAVHELRRAGFNI